MDDDRRLTERLARDLDAAFEALVTAHQDRCYSIALRVLGDPADAEEVAQDALVRAYRALASYDAARITTLRLRPWLAAIVVNLARNRRRNRADREPAFAISVPSVAEAVDRSAAGRAGASREGDPHAAAAHAEDRRELEAALATLTPTIREAVVLRHIAGLSTTETAEALGRPEGTIKAQVHRGLAALRLRLTLPADSATIPAPARPALAGVTR